MKKKELKKLAQRIAALEKTASSNNQDEAKKAQQQIMDLTKKIKDVEDFFYLDELIQEFLEEEKS